MAQPVSKYNGNYITCYPGSNQQDDGKLQLEFNMARIVTRLSSKNFCVVNPSYVISQTTDITTGKPCLQITEGQCSINGMDLIMTSALTIAEPETTGTFYLKFKLARDSSNNVLGDFIYGVDTTFDGVYLTYDTEKPDPVLADELYIGKVTWDGENFTDIEEDEDKYGRIWAEDILCKINDPKHPDITRLTLQEWIYKVPDWYVSKEGDVEYGAIEFLPGRNTVTTPGVKIQAINENESLIEFNAPSAVDTNLKGSIEADMDGITLNLGNAYITNKNDNYKLTMFNGQAISVESVNTTSIKGNTTSLESFAENGYKLQASPQNLVFTDSISDDLKFGINYSSADILTQTVGKSIWQYNDTNKTLSLLNTDTDLLSIQPDTSFLQDVRVIENLYLGTQDSLPQTLLSRTQWYLRENVTNGKVISFTPSLIETINPSLSNDNNIIFNLRNSTDSIHTKLFDNGKIELLNGSVSPQVQFKDGNATYNVTVQKTIGKKELNIDGDLTVNGVVTGTKVLNAVYNDIVEFMEKENYDEVIEAGDVVYFTDSGKVTKYKEGINQNAIAGIVSSEETWGQALGGAGLDDNQKVPVALKGRVFVKTDNIMIHAGDYISVDACGCVYNSGEVYDPRYTLGIATRPEKDGKVFVLVK